MKFTLFSNSTPLWKYLLLYRCENCTGIFRWLGFPGTYSSKKTFSMKFLGFFLISLKTHAYSLPSTFTCTLYRPYSVLSDLVFMAFPPSTISTSSYFLPDFGKMTPGHLPACLSVRTLSEGCLISAWMICLSWLRTDFLRNCLLVAFMVSSARWLTPRLGLKQWYLLRWSRLVHFKAEEPYLNIFIFL